MERVSRMPIGRPDRREPAALLALGGSCYASAMKGDIHYCTTDDGVQIAYSIIGQGPPLVRVLGWFTHLEYEWQTPFWRAFIGRLSDHYTLVRYDGRGTGLSDRDIEGITWDGSVLDLAAVIDATGFDKVAVL